jgi:hypothetical protein
LDTTIVFLEQRCNRISLLVRFTKHRQLARQVGGSCTLSIIEKEAIAPYIHIGLALGVAPSGRIQFGSLEFTDIDGPAPFEGLIPSQALCFGDLDFVADCLGQLWLNEENAAPPHISTPDHGSAQVGGAIVDFGALACMIYAYLGVTPKPELSRRVFYVLANAFAQLSGGGPLPLEAEF